MIHEFLAGLLKCKEKKAIEHKICWQRTLKSTTAVLVSITVILLKTNYTLSSIMLQREPGLG
jgi:hypothetical protein